MYLCDRENHLIFTYIIMSICQIKIVVILFKIITGIIHGHVNPGGQKNFLICGTVSASQSGHGYKIKEIYV